MGIKISPKSFRILLAITFPEKKSIKVLSDSWKRKFPKLLDSIEKTIKLLPWKLLQSKDHKLPRKKSKTKLLKKKVKCHQKNINKNLMLVVLEARKRAQWLQSLFIKLKETMKTNGQLWSSLIRSSSKNKKNYRGSEKKNLRKKWKDN